MDYCDGMVQEQRKHHVLHEQHILPTDIWIYIVYPIGIKWGGNVA